MFCSVLSRWTAQLSTATTSEFAFDGSNDMISLLFNHRGKIKYVLRGQRMPVNMNPQIIKETGGDKTRQWKLQWVYCFHAFIVPKSSESSTIASGK